MQKKQLNNILLVVVIIIWSGLIYKFAYPYFKKKESLILSPSNKKTIKHVNVYTKDTFELNNLERDPFLGKLAYKPLSSKLIVKKNKTTKKPKKLKWPKIIYLGFVKSKKNKQKLGLVRLNDRLYKVHSNDKIKNVKIGNVTNDSITINLGNETKYFKK